MEKKNSDVLQNVRGVGLNDGWFYRQSNNMHSISFVIMLIWYISMLLQAEKNMNNIFSGVKFDCKKDSPTELVMPPCGVVR